MARALVQLADRFKACIQDVDSIVRALQVPSCRLESDHSSVGQDASAHQREGPAKQASCGNQLPATGGGGGWLAGTMGWLRGGYLSTMAQGEAADDEVGRSEEVGRSSLQPSKLPVNSAQDLVRDVNLTACIGSVPATKERSSSGDCATSAICCAVEQAVLNACREVGGCVDKVGHFIARLCRRALLGCVRVVSTPFLTERQE